MHADIEFGSDDNPPSTKRLLMVLNLLWEFAILWKNLVFLSPSRIQKALDFCLQHI